MISQYTPGTQPGHRARKQSRPPSVEPAYALAAPVSIADTPLTQMELGALVQHCRVESERFYQRQPYDARFAYELFRRALVERNEAAWVQLYQHYGRLVEVWVQRNASFVRSGESSEFFVSAAFIRFWRAITPERFTQFPTLASLLNYLQRCTTCAIIDSVRSQSWSEMVPEESSLGDRLPIQVPDEEAIERVSRAEFWQYIGTLLNSEAERAVVVGCFVIGMKPGDIYDQRPDLFTNVREVYTVKRNVLARLGRSPELQRLGS